MKLAYPMCHEKMGAERRLLLTLIVLAPSMLPSDRKGGRPVARSYGFGPSGLRTQGVSVPGAFSSAGSAGEPGGAGPPAFQVGRAPAEPGDGRRARKLAIAKPIAFSKTLPRSFRDDYLHLQA